MTKRLRDKILVRDAYTCGYCSKKLDPKELEVDHIIPRTSGGTDEEHNLITACKKCNNKKSDRLPDTPTYVSWTNTYHLIDGTCKVHESARFYVQTKRYVTYAPPKFKGTKVHNVDSVRSIHINK